jgi:hypothetical protein
MRAIELNGVQVDKNKQAFDWGRRCAHDLASVQAQFVAAKVIEFVKKPSLDETVAAPRRLPHRLPGRGLRGAYSSRWSTASRPPRRRWAARA